MTRFVTVAALIALASAAVAAPQVKPSLIIVSDTQKERLNAADVLTPALTLGEQALDVKRAMTPDTVGSFNNSNGILLGYDNNPGAGAALATETFTPFAEANEARLGDALAIRFPGVLSTITVNLTNTENSAFEFSGGLARTSIYAYDPGTNTPGALIAAYDAEFTAAGVSGTGLAFNESEVVGWGPPDAAGDINIPDNVIVLVTIDAVIGSSTSACTLSFENNGGDSDPDNYWIESSPADGNPNLTEVNRPGAGNLALRLLTEADYNGYDNTTLENPNFVNTAITVPVSTAGAGENADGVPGPNAIGDYFTLARPGKIIGFQTEVVFFSDNNVNTLPTSTWQIQIFDPNADETVEPDGSNIIYDFIWEADVTLASGFGVTYFFTIEELEAELGVGEELPNLPAGELAYRFLANRTDGSDGVDFSVPPFGDESIGPGIQFPATTGTSGTGLYAKFDPANLDGRVVIGGDDQVGTNFAVLTQPTLSVLTSPDYTGDPAAFTLSPADNNAVAGGDTPNSDIAYDLDAAASVTFTTKPAGAGADIGIITIDENLNSIALGATTGVATPVTGQRTTQVIQTSQAPFQVTFTDVNGAPALMNAFVFESNTAGNTAVDASGTQLITLAQGVSDFTANMEPRIVDAADIDAGDPNSILFNPTEVTVTPPAANPGEAYRFDFRFPGLGTGSLFAGGLITSPNDVDRVDVVTVPIVAAYDQPTVEFDDGGNTITPTINGNVVAGLETGDKVIADAIGPVNTAGLSIGNDAGATAAISTFAATFRVYNLDGNGDPILPPIFEGGVAFTANPPDLPAIAPGENVELFVGYGGDAFDLTQDNILITWEYDPAAFDVGSLPIIPLMSDTLLAGQSDQLSYWRDGADVLAAPGQPGLFLSIIDPVVSGICADSNCDGAVNTTDIDFFVAAILGGEAGWAALFAPDAPTCDFIISNDTNGDGSVNTTDIDPFVAELLGTPGGCP